MDLESIKIKEIVRGYAWDSETQTYRCLHCRKTYSADEIYPFENHFFTAEKAVKTHVQTEHADRFRELMEDNKKYLSLTERQKELLTLFGQGMSDHEIANEKNLSPSTVRHQRFVLREKAKSAKLFLALWELATNQTTDNPSIIPIHGGAKMVDERYVITEEENKKILSSVFYSLSPLKLKVFSAKEKKKIVILRRIIQEFEPGKTYSEREVNEILKEIYEDYATIRRYLVEYGYMTRTNDCREYRRL